MNRKRLNILLLTAALCLNLFPTSVFAEESIQSTENPEMITETESDEISEYEEFSDSVEFSDSAETSESEEISESNEFSDPVEISESEEITDSEEFIESEESFSDAFGQSVIESEIEPVAVENGICEETDEILLGYIESEVGDDYVDVTDYKHTLNSLEQTIYDYLKDQVQMIAAGELSSTKIQVPSDIYSWSYTYEELGIDSSADSSEISGAIRQKIQSDLSSSKIIQSLLADMPYQFYWNMQRRAGSGYRYSCSSSGIKLYNLNIYFTVASPFGSDYTIDTPKVDMVNNAVANASQIVENAGAFSDIQKLTYYKTSICDLVSYDSDAASSSGYDPDGNYDGSPWQLINVFDGDASTNVVCEGYAKAFQLLCDETVFNDSHIICLSVTGTMHWNGSDTGHAWNLMIMEDKQSYLVDITNSDNGTIGSNGGLFLAGTADGSAACGYTFTLTGGKTITYTYSTYTSSIYSGKKLTLSSAAYDADTVVKCTHNNTKTVNVSKATCTKNGYSGDVICTDCGDLLEKGQSIPMTEHVWDKGNRVSEPSESALGETDYLCTVCGTVKKEYDLKITAQPSDKTVYEGNSAVFQISALGGSLSYQWEYRENGDSEWIIPSNISSKTSCFTFASAAKDTHNGYQFRCTVTSAEDDSLSVTSDIVTLTVKPYITITSQPVATTVIEGNIFTFKVAAVSNAESALYYQWQYSKDGGVTWTDSAQKTKIYRITAKSVWNGWRYRCIISDAAGNSAASDSAELTVMQPAIMISTQPSSVSVLSGDRFTFSVGAVSTTDSTLTYQWQYSKDSAATWIDSAQKTHTYSFTAKAAYNDRKYRCIVTDSKGNSVISNSVTLTVIQKPIVINTQPADLTVTAGNRFCFRVSAASSTGSALSYQWQYSKDSGSTWTDSAQKTKNYSIQAKTNWNGWYYRCIITDADGNSVISDTARLTVKPILEITLQPTAASVTEGNRLLFKVEAVSNTDSILNYQWQYSKDSETTWINSAQKTGTYSILARANWDGWNYRCIIYDADGNIITTSSAKLTVKPVIDITGQPADTSVSAGEKFSFHVTAVSNIQSALSYQWQYSKDSGLTWIDSVQKTSTYTLTAKTIWNGRYYRCIITDDKGNTKTTATAKLTVQ